MFYLIIRYLIHSDSTIPFCKVLSKFNYVWSSHFPFNLIQSSGFRHIACFPSCLSNILVKFVSSLQNYILFASQKELHFLREGQGFIVQVSKLDTISF